MDIQTLKKRLTVTPANQIRVPDLTLLGNDLSISIVELHDLCYDTTHPKLAFRAAWVLEYIVVHHPDRFVMIAETFLTRLPSQKNHSCQRQFTNILIYLTRSQASNPYRDVIQPTHREQLVETVFNWFIDPHTPVAVQANCMDVLLNMSSEFEWIKEELKQQIEFLLRNGSAAIQSRGKKVLTALGRSKS